MRIFAAAACLGIAAFNTPVFAGIGWELSEDEKRCFIMTAWEGPGDTRMMIGSEKNNTDRLVTIMMFNDNWTIKSGDTVGKRVKLTDGDAYLYSDAAVGLDHGFGFFIAEKHVANLVGLGGITVYLDKQAIDKLNWSDFAYGWAQLSSCINKWRLPREEAERKQKLYDSLPRDPFAKGDDANKAQPGNGK